MHTLHFGQNQLLLVYDERTPLEVPMSKNKETVMKNKSIYKPRMIGFAVF
jgi:hypothetical protein